MATAYACPPMLRLKHSAQSGAKIMTAGYAVVYTESSTISFLFMGANLDLSLMQAGDIVDVRVRKRITSVGNWINHDQKQYNGARPTGHPLVYVGVLANIYGIEVSMRQTAGVLRTFDCGFMDAKRLGLP